VVLVPREEEEEEEEEEVGAELSSSLQSCDCRSEAAAEAGSGSVLVDWSLLDLGQSMVDWSLLDLGQSMVDWSLLVSELKEFPVNLHEVTWFHQNPTQRQCSPAFRITI